ncbi:unnamed protein product [Caenorhabditis bovis]|uniref:CYtochrome P450 family n=1 Tax=Caenorhabditis bovis TaxID=2654633 RepID=A0A8S1ED48_9PELO|nr:unnamed protein product [Caenorhabditis bovis]
MLFAVFLLTIITISFIHLKLKQRKLPKGPQPLPLIGNLHQIGYYAKTHGGLVEGFKEFRRRYGDVFTVWLGPFPTVHICDYALAQETHLKQANSYAHRFVKGILDYIREGRGIVASNGDFWQEHRRFALHTLRNFGLGRNIMEGRILEEIDYRSSTFFDLLIGSIINQLLISERFKKNDATFEKIKTSLEAALENLTILEGFTPVWILKSRLFKFRHEYMFGPFDAIHNIIKNNIANRVAEIVRGDHVLSEDGNDFLDAYLYKIQCDKEKSYILDTLAVDMFDLWQAGQETTSTTLSWGFLCLLRHPEVVEKLRKELNRITMDGSRNLSLSDKPNTPYLNATINEVQRVASILNINLFRELQEDTYIDGQLVGAGAAVTVELSLLHTDEKVFENPGEFNPDRFITNEGLEKKLIPFGIGKRACLGESLARAELYLVLGNLILRYNIEPVGELPPLRSLTPFGGMKRPPPYELRLKPIK